MSDRKKSDARTAIGWVTLVGGALVFLYWALYFMGSVALAGEARIVNEYEAAFPVADALFATTLVITSIGLFKGKPYGPFFLVAAASMSLYLGILDVTFYGGQGAYLPVTGAGALELALNALCIGGGALGLRMGWLLLTPSIVRLD